ncbi:hypothetical protein NPIL_409901, partial [Nephila pilipes]
MDIVVLNSNILFDKKHGIKMLFLQFKKKLNEQIFESSGNYREGKQFTARTVSALTRLS